MNPVKEWQKRISYMREVPSSFIRMFCHATKFKKHHYILLLRKFLLMRCFLRQGLDQIEEKLWHDQARTFEKLDGTLKLSSTKQQRLKIPSSFTEIQYFFSLQYFVFDLYSKQLKSLIHQKMPLFGQHTNQILGNLKNLLTPQQIDEDVNFLRL